MLHFAARISKGDRICTQMLLQPSGHNMALIANEWLEDWFLWKSCKFYCTSLFDLPLLTTSSVHSARAWWVSMAPTCQYDSLQPFPMYNHAQQYPWMLSEQTQDIVRNHEHLLVLSYQWLVIYNVQTSGLFGST